MKLDVVALADAGPVAVTSMAGSTRPITFALLVTTPDGDPVEGLSKSAFDVALIAPVSPGTFETTAFLEVAEGIPPGEERSAGVRPKEDFPGFYALAVEPGGESGWREGDHVFGVTVKRSVRGTSDRGSTLVKVRIA